ncbi:CU044_5270 family protein [Nonomuraea lactucae]|uniref:CU044_5270 family protein n=1 Tax=Nonomuraea lactucae TaxID=2249762 RepID=UPI000DE3A058|nr:CU044_5270 family protein [Nonomuraea lactucae]
MDELNGRPGDAGEVAAVRDLLSMPAPSPEAVDAGRARLLATLTASPARPVSPALSVSPAGPVSPAALLPLSPARRWAPLRNGLVGVVVAAGLALAVTLPPGSPLRLSPVPPEPATAEPGARQVLLAAASAMARAPSDGAYWRTSVVTGQLILSPDRRYVIKRRSTRETWLTKEYAGRDRWTGRYLGAAPATPQDEAEWRAAGSPANWRYPADVTGLGRVSSRALVESAPGEPRNGPHRVGWRDADGILTKRLVTWEALRAIPADPTRLRAFLVTRIAGENGAYVGREMEAELRESCLEIISGLPVAPEVRASAYRILASIPGMKAEGRVTDPLGRTGQGLSYRVVREGRPSDERLVIDPASGLPLAEETTSAGEAVGGRDVRLGSFTAFQEIGWTDEEPAH